MIADVLAPRTELLGKEYVLVQAWKKTSSYIRYHNWFADTFELDRAAVNLPRFIGELAERLTAPYQWTSDSLRIVPAPKSQQWHVMQDAKSWEPVEKDQNAVKLRPLAHVSLRDQVAATAVMLCLANLVETLQGDTRKSVTDAAHRKEVISYGNRLFCQVRGDRLYHHWGSAKLYRSYYQDYRTFLSRPQAVAEIVAVDAAAQAVIVHSDLRQFYDRVRPEILAKKIDALKAAGHDQSFYDLARRMFNWKWDRKDYQEVNRYAKQAALSDFSTVALPQGLVASGFFANVVLLDFDQSLREALSTEIAPGIVLADVCRYVDDLRIVLTIDRKSLRDIEHLITKWLGGLLDVTLRGLHRLKTRRGPPHTEVTLDH